MRRLFTLIIAAMTVLGALAGCQKSDQQKVVKVGVLVPLELPKH